MYVQADLPRSQDKLIITTAIPQITDEFHSANDIGWYGTAYLLTNCAFLLVFGKVYTILNVKVTFLTAVLLFEVGSAICGAAPNSIAFIIGRAIAGLGAGGVQSGIVRFPFSSSIIHLPHLQFFIFPHRTCSHHGALDRHYCLRCSAGQTAPISGFLWCRVWRRFGDRPAGWWRFHHERYLEMVLLHQPSLGRRGHGVRLLLAPYP